MKLRLCLCCGESLAEHGNALSRNPNLCASCSSMADGMTDSSISGPAQPIAEATPDPQNLAAGRAELDSTSILEVIRVRASTLTPIMQEMLHSRPSSHWGINE